MNHMVYIRKGFNKKNIKSYRIFRIGGIFFGGGLPDFHNFFQKKKIVFFIKKKKDDQNGLIHPEN